MKIENKKKQMNEKWMENDAVFVVVIIFSPPQPQHQNQKMILECRLRRVGEDFPPLVTWHFPTFLISLEIHSSAEYYPPCVNYNPLWNTQFEDNSMGLSNGKW